MGLRSGIAVVVAAGLLATPVLAQEQYALQMEYVAGEQSVTGITFTGIGTISLDLPGGPAEPGDLWINGRLDLREEVTSVDDGGVAEVEWTLGALTTEYQMLGMTLKITLEEGQVQVLMNDRVVFDSLDAEQAKRNPILALIGQGLTVRADTTGRIVGMPQLELLLKAMMPDSDLTGTLQQGTGPLPPAPVRVGDTWEERHVWPYGVPEDTERPVFITRHTFEALEPVGGHECARIPWAGRADVENEGMALPAFVGPLLGGARPLGITVNALSGDWAGTYYFDFERGTTRKIDAVITLNLEMTQRLEIPAPPGQQDEAVTAGTPDARNTQEMEIGIKIEDLIIDVAVEVAQ